MSSEVAPVDNNQVGENLEGRSGAGSLVSPYSDGEKKQAKKLLKNECEQIWEEISKVSDQLDLRRPDTAQTEELPAGALHQTKAALLKAQADIIRETPPTVLPQNDAIQFEALMQELQLLNTQLQETLTLVQSEQRELDLETNREDLFRTEKKQVKEVLVKKLEATLSEAQEDEATRFQQAFTEVESKEAKLNRYHRTIMKKMATFISKHFPEPSANQQCEWRAKSKKAHLAQSQKSSEKSLVSLQTILQELMNLCVESPHNPYLEITDEFWPPYVELLLRSGIASRKPDTNDRIRMTPFHL